MESIWDNRKYLNDILYIADECMMSVFPKAMKEQIIHMVRYRCPNGLALMQVRHGTLVVEAGDQHGETLVADLCVRGVWLRCYLLFIVMPSHICAIYPANVFNAEVEKKNVYADVCFCLFTPFCFWISGY